MKTLPSVTTYTAVITALSHGSGRGALVGLAAEGGGFIVLLCLHLSSPQEVSTLMAGMGERDCNLGYCSAGLVHRLKPWWRCVGAKTLDYELWYRHNFLCYFYAGVNNVQQKIPGEALIIYNTTAKRAGADLPEPLLLEERNWEK